MADSPKNTGPVTVLVESQLDLRGKLDSVRAVASGGMAQIFQARQPTLERFIAIKKLREDLVRNAETLERFRREARALAQVLHQNIAHVYDFVETGTEAYILMEYIEGIDLSTVIQKVGSVPPMVSSLVLLNLARGLEYIHAHHLIHRDIKPSNIRLTNRGEVKLMDFGIVMNIENESLTRPGTMVGSPSYLSPEQVLGDPITPQADIFLLGICFYEMLTGVRPFKEEGGRTVFQRIRECEYVPVQSMNPSVPRALVRIVERCLRKEPEERFETMKGLIRELEKYLGTTRVSHSQDVILKYLDDEALLNPAVPYLTKLETKKTWAERFPPASLVLVILVGLLGFGLGYWWHLTHAL